MLHVFKEMPRVIANTAFAGRLEEITELQTNLKSISASNKLVEELNFYIPGKSPANIANTAFGERVQNIINLQEDLDNLEIFQITFETAPYLDPLNAIFSTDIALPLSEATNINTFSFSYDTSKVYTVSSVEASVFNPGYTMVVSTFDSTVYDLTNYQNDITGSYKIINPT